MTETEKKLEQAIQEAIGYGVELAIADAPGVMPDWAVDLEEALFEWQKEKREV